MDSVGSKRIPLLSLEPMKVAKAMLLDLWGPAPIQIHLWKGMYWTWDKERGVWSPHHREWLEQQAWLWLEDRYVVVGDDEGYRRVAPNQKLASAVAKGLWSLLSDEIKAVPGWVDGEGPDPFTLVTFLDKVYDIKTGAVYERDGRWFDPQTLPIELPLGEGAPCPVWERSLQEWGGGDPEWTELVERMLGYCLMPTRKYARVFLQQGEPRGGKGLSVLPLRLLQGLDLFKGTSVEDLTGSFGLGGVEYARTLLVSEMSEMDPKAGSRLSSVLKSIVGQDRIEVNRKYQQPVQVTAACVPILQVQKNEILNFPDKGRGLSSKMVVVPHRFSFVGKENRNLDQEVRKELPGITWRLVKAARRLEGETEEEKRWPVVEGAEEVLKEYRFGAHRMDQFLDAMCFKNPEGFITADILRWAFKTWREAAGVKWAYGLNLEYGFLKEVERGSSWPVFRVKKAAHDGGSEWVIRGVSLKVTPDLE